MRFISCILLRPQAKAKALNPKLSWAEWAPEAKSAGASRRLRSRHLLNIMGVCGLGLGVWGLGFGIQGLGIMAVERVLQGLGSGILSRLALR